MEAGVNYTITPERKGGENTTNNWPWPAGMSQNAPIVIQNAPIVIQNAPIVIQNAPIVIIGVALNLIFL